MTAILRLSDGMEMDDWWIGVVDMESAWLPPEN